MFDSNLETEGFDSLGSQALKELLDRLNNALGLLYPEINEKYVFDKESDSLKNDSVREEQQQKILEYIGEK